MRRLLLPALVFAAAVLGVLSFFATGSRIAGNTTRIDSAQQKALIAYSRVAAIEASRREVATAFAVSDQRICLQVEALKRTITLVIKKNAPSSRIAYYREHPKELAAARAVTLRSLRAFLPRSCHALPSQKASR